jgi:hypothetical protein
MHFYRRLLPPRLQLETSILPQQLLEMRTKHENGCKCFLEVTEKGVFSGNVLERYFSVRLCISLSSTEQRVCRFGLHNALMQLS